MKKIVYFLAAILICSISISCVKKVPVNHSQDQPLTLIVMDSTQALLDAVQVKVGKQTYTTSYDGRIVFKPEQLAGVKSLQLSCEGFKSQTLSLTGEQTLIATLVPNKEKKNNKDKEWEHVKYSLTSRAMADEAVPVMGRADVPLTGGAVKMVENHVIYDEALEPTSAGRLTAGEVNDFAKWALWRNILENSHKEYIDTWRIAPRHRYTVQVTNKEGFPVVNYALNLTDANGNTLFQALTDNTGKAELWNGLLNQGANDLRVNGEPLAENGNTRIVIDEPCEAPEGVDVLFVFDATGSMGDELRYLQKEMNDVIARAKEATGGLAIRTGAVVYRDHTDEYLTRISRLTDDITVTQSFIDKQEASGGGDYEEAVPEALMAALNSAGWDSEARARIAFLVLDAPCHEDSATVALLHEQILNAAAQGVRIVPVVCSGLEKSGEYLMRSIALATNGTSFFLTDDSGIGGKHLKPTTDTLQVEHLNDMLVRTIVEFSLMPACAGEEVAELLISDFVPNPFSTQDIASNPDIPHGEGVHYIVDISGKLIGMYEGDIEQLQLNQYQLPIGIYFIKTYIDGKWYTKKVLVR